MNAYQTLDIATRGQVTEVALNRPDRRNAFNARMMRELTEFFTAVDASPARVVVLTGKGGDFCSGADLDWMGEAADPAPASRSQLVLAMYTAILACRLPIICHVFGRVYAGGIGLCSIADITIAETGTTFCLSEVRVGLAPAVMAPFVVERIGAARFRELALTARLFSAAEAYRLGLVDQVLPAAAIADGIAAQAAEIGKGAPGAIAASKAISRSLSGASWASIGPLLANILDELRRGPEARTGIAAFRAHRTPDWGRHDEA